MNKSVHAPGHHLKKSRHFIWHQIKVVFLFLVTDYGARLKRVNRRDGRDGRRIEGGNRIEGIHFGGQL